MPELDTNYGMNLLDRVTKGVALRGMLTENAMREAKLANLPEEMKYLKESRALDLRKGTAEAKKAEYDQTALESLAPLVKAKAFSTYLTDTSTRMTFDQYRKGGRQFLVETAEPLGPAAKNLAQSLPDPDAIESEAGRNEMMPQDYFEKVVKPQTLMNTKDRLELMEKESQKMTAQANLLKAMQEKWGTPTKGVDAEGKDIYFQIDNTGNTRILKGVQPPDTAEKWSSPQKGIDAKGNPIVYQVDAKGKKRVIEGVQPEPKKGMKVYDAQGNLILDTSGGDITPKVKSDIETKIINAKEQLARIQSMAAEFRPEYQEIGTRLKNAWTSLKARLGEGVSKEDAGELYAFKQYQRKAAENINLYIKELTGAQMSIKEADRLKLAQPDPGEKWYQGDDPITFKGKMDDVQKFTRAAIARYEYYLSLGFKLKEIEKMVTENKAASLDDIVKNLR